MARRQREFEQLVRGCTDDLYRYAYWLCGDAAQAEDLVQETLLRAWRFMDRLQDAARIRPWLITTLRREYARGFERKRPAQTVALDALAEVLPAPETPDQSPELALEQHQLLGRLLQLPRHYREALVLQVVFGYSIEEVAVLLESPVTTVNNWLYRARALLQAPRPATAPAVHCPS